MRYEHKLCLMGYASTQTGLRVCNRCVLRCRGGLVTKSARVQKVSVAGNSVGSPLQGDTRWTVTDDSIRDKSPHYG